MSSSKKPLKRLFKKNQFIEECEVDKEEGYESQPDEYDDADANNDEYERDGFIVNDSSDEDVAVVDDEHRALDQEEELNIEKLIEDQFQAATYARETHNNNKRRIISSFLSDSETPYSAADTNTGSEAEQNDTKMPDGGNDTKATFDVTSAAVEGRPRDYGITFRQGNYLNDLKRCVIENTMIQYQTNCLFKPEDLEKVLEHMEEYWFLRSGETPLTQVQKEEKMANRFGTADDRALPSYKQKADEAKQTELDTVEMLELMFVNNLMIDETDERLKQYSTRFRNVKAMLNSVYEDALEKWRKCNIQSLPDSELQTILAGAMIDDKKLTDAQKLMKYFGAACKRQGYFKDGDQLYEEVKWKGNYTHSYVPVKKAFDFLFEITRENTHYLQWQWRTSNGGNPDIVIKDFVRNSEVHCPKLARDRNCWSFGNGFWDAREDKFYPYGDNTILPNKYSVRFIEDDLKDIDPIGPDWLRDGNKCINDDGKVIYDYDHPEMYDKPPVRSWYDIDTPVVHRIMADQGWTRPVIKWLYVFLGRLACEVGRAFGGDNWQVCPLLYGKAGTGKSTLAHFAKQMFLKDDTFELESAGETTFALEMSVGKLMWCILELKKELRLSSSRYQQMVSGEPMVVPRKGKTPHMGRWSAPGMMVGNDTLPFKDAQGSIARRTVVFEFLKRIGVVDTTMDEKMQKELPNFIRKAVCGYFFTREWVGTRGIWTPGILPDYFHKTAQNLKKQVDEAVKVMSEQCVVDMHNMSFVLPMDVFIKELVSRFPNQKSTTDDTNLNNIRATLEMQNIRIFTLDYTNRTQLEALERQFPDKNCAAYKEKFNEINQNKTSDISTVYCGVNYQGQVIEEGEFVAGIMFKDMVAGAAQNHIIKCEKGHVHVAKAAQTATEIQSRGTKKW